MVDFITQFDEEEQPEIKMATVINQTIQNSVALARQSTVNGWWPQVYAPTNLDLVRWKLGKYWDDKGAWAYSTSEWGNKGDQPNTLWEQVTIVPDSNFTNEDREKKSLIKVERNTNYGLIDQRNQANGNAAWLWIVDSEQNEYYTEQDLRNNAPSFDGVQGISVFGDAQVGVRGKVFYDHVCELEIPHAKKSVDNAMFGSIRVSYADVDPTYNFYVGSYECILDELNADEKVLPNMYAFLLVEQQQFGEDVIINNDPTSIDNIFEQNVTLNGLISGTLFAANEDGKALKNAAEVLSAMRNKEQKLGKASSKGQYFDKFANKYPAFNSDTNSNTMYANKFTNLIVPQSNLNLYNDFNDKRLNFPMCVDISFSTDMNTEFAQALKQSQMSSLLMKDVTTGSFGESRAPGVLDYEDPNWNLKLRVPFESSKYTKEYYSTATEEQDRPVVLVHFGTRNSPYRNPWSRDSYWTPIANIIHDSGQGRNIGLPLSVKKRGTEDIDNSFFIGDAVVVKKGQNPGEDNISGQILAYASKAKPVADRFGEVPAVDGLIRSWQPIVYDTSLAGNDSEAARNNVPDIGVFYPEAMRHKRFSPSERIEHPFFIYGDQTEIPPGRPRYKRTGDYEIFNSSEQTLTTSELKQWDLTNWIKNLANVDPEDNDEKITYLGPYNQEIADAYSNQGTQFYRALTTVILGGKFTKLVNQKTRTFEEILGGKKAYSETVFYKIEKWALNNRGEYANGSPIQSIYLPNSNEIDVHRYIDTQVKYDKRYGYKIFAYQAVFGNRYRYSLNRVPESDDAGDQTGTGPVQPGQAEICVFNRPSIRLVEVPYYFFKGIVMDSPPIWPQVEIVPYLDKNNKVLFMFQGNVGNYRLNPINILEGDAEQIMKMRDAQKEYTGPIEYKSDDQARTFQVFRMEMPPSTYQDFSFYKLADAETDLSSNSEPLKAATSAAFVDDIQPNKKYYYMFRSVDVHGHVSNPSPVYQVEITDDGGAPVLLTSVFPIIKEKEPPQRPAKPAKKYIYITPNSVHLGVNKEKSGLMTENGKAGEIPGNVLSNGPTLGNAEETLWGKKFKIRLVSKKTGKKIDFKLEFKQEHEAPTDQGDITGQKIC